VTAPTYTPVRSDGVGREEYLDRRAKIKDAIDNTSPTTEVPKQ
jgi:hypothetical protein